MATKMHILAVIKALMSGGYICWKCEPAANKNAFTVHQIVSNNMPSKHLGHISLKQFEELMQRGIIEPCPNKRTTDKYGNTYICCELSQQGRGEVDLFALTPGHHGAWRYVGTDPVNNKTIFCCSECLEEVEHDGTFAEGNLPDPGTQHPYCTGCGARMDASVEGEV